MFNQLLELYRELPEAQRGTVLAAAVAAIGVTATAIFAIITAVINAISSNVTIALNSKYQHKHWRREKLWKAYADSIDSLYTADVSSGTHRDDLNNFCYFIDLCLISVYQDYTRAVPYLFNDMETHDASSLLHQAIDFKDKATESLNKYVEQNPILVGNIIADDNPREIQNKVENYALSLNNYYDDMFTHIDEITRMTYKAINEDVEQTYLDLISSKVGIVYKEYVQPRKDRPKSFELRIFLAQRMKRL